jgi:hypothetical protein
MRRPISPTMLIAAFAACAWACSNPDHSYYPLQEGFIWEYQVSVRIRSGLSNTPDLTYGRAEVRNLPVRTLEGRTVKPQQIEMAGQLGFTFLIDDEHGIYQFARQPLGTAKPVFDDAATYVLKYPAQVGAQWQDKTNTLLLERNTPVPQSARVVSSAEIVSVPAGTFKGCLEIQTTGSISRRFPDLAGAVEIQIDTETWYAPGVGMIKTVHQESSDRPILPSGEMAFELTSFKRP